MKIVLTAERLTLAVGSDSAARLAVYRSFIRDLTVHEHRAVETLTDTTAKGDATEAFCEDCETFLVGSNPLPALEVVAQHKADYPGHDVLFLEPADQAEKNR